jgi:hypothetical protein
MNSQELSTTLAALQLLQSTFQTFDTNNEPLYRVPNAIYDILYEHPPLTPKEIDQLCEELNHGE